MQEFGAGANTFHGNPIIPTLYQIIGSDIFPSNEIMEGFPGWPSPIDKSRSLGTDAKTFDILCSQFGS